MVAAVAYYIYHLYLSSRASFESKLRFFTFADLTFNFQWFLISRLLNLKIETRDITEYMFLLCQQELGFPATLLS